MRLIVQFILILFASSPVLAQSASLHGQITDHSGLIIRGAQVTLNASSGLVKIATSDDDGWYSFADVPTGDYIVQASAPNLALLQPAKIALKSGVQTLNLKLSVVLTAEEVTVREDLGPTVTTEPSNNASAMVLRGDDLKALGDSPEDLQADLQALAGPSAGPNGGAIFIDGFSGGQLPSKESIREIRINQNPFSPEYEHLGIGRIEIITKPGTDKFRGSFYHNFADRFWNSRNPYARQKAPFLLNESGGSLSGPINKRASFVFDARRDAIDNGSIINALTLDPETLAIINPFTATPQTRQRRVGVTPRIDYQLNKRITLVFRYHFTRSDMRDAGIGNFSLVSRGYQTRNTHQTVQITETAVLGAHVINETRFQFSHTDDSTIANRLSPAIQVLGSFNGGGAPVGRSFNAQSNYEFQNYTSISRGPHGWKFGIRLRREMIDNTSVQNFGGTFTFGGGLGPALDPNNQLVLDSSGQPVLAPITSIEQYRRTLFFQQLGFSPAQIRLLGGGATQFSINAGIPQIVAGQIDIGAFVGDDWRMRPNLTLSLGLRYETQTNIHDWRDFAPRLAIAWAPGGRAQNSRPKTVLRAGFGLFYDRFALSNTLTALRYNGIIQRQFVVTNPDFFPTIPAISSLTGFQTIQTIREVSSMLRAPTIMQSTISLERQLPFNTTVAITYANSHGVYMLRSEDINAPLPGTYNPRVPGSGVFPFGRPGPVLLMESSGLYNQRQLITNINAKISRNVSLFGSYALNFARSNTDGIGTYPAKPYDFTGEYGPAATDVRHRFSLNGWISTKWNVSFSPFVIVQSAPPFNITVGRDLYGTTLFNGRPGIPTDPSKPGLIRTKYGLLDPNPAPDEKILPRNYGRGAGSITVNLRLTKTFGFGPARAEGAESSPGPGGGGGGGRDRRGGGRGFGAGGGRRGPISSPPASHPYNLTFSMSVRNLLNHTNPGPIVGNITSPLFGQANQPAGGGFGGFSEAANNRRLELQMRFTF